MDFLSSPYDKKSNFPDPRKPPESFGLQLLPMLQSTIAVPGETLHEREILKLRTKSELEDRSAERLNDLFRTPGLSF